MSTDRLQFAAKPILDCLRYHCGDSEFGYRVQALFAHVLLRLGAKILEINAQGHPDIKAQLADRLLLIQVKSVLHGSRSSMFQLTEGDLRGIEPGQRSEGYLALLDCAEPIEWILEPYNQLRRYLSRSAHITSLRAEQEEVFSRECTEEFVEMVLGLEKRLPNLTYRLLVDRALAGRVL